jgi:hypothetical protein
MKTSHLLILAALAVSIVGCHRAPGDRQLVWVKDGASNADLQLALYECERDTRAAALSFGGGITGAAEAQAFAQRCMSAKGYSLVTLATINGSRRPTTYSHGVAYGVGEIVICRFPMPDKDVAVTAGDCVNGGGYVVRRKSTRE